VPGICEAPCIGMCDSLGEQTITCDLEGEFHSYPVQSIMHEIGHILGLRHEHVRRDRNQYVDTTFAELQDGQGVGAYDFLSIMHYEFGNFRDGHLKISKEFREFMLRNFPDDAQKLLKEKEDRVGKEPKISKGDREAVQLLTTLAIRQAEQKKKEEEAKKKQEEEAKRKREAQLASLAIKRQAEQKKKEEEAKREREELALLSATSDDPDLDSLGSNFRASSISRGRQYRGKGRRQF